MYVMFQDMLGNGEAGRYFLVPGSAGRAKDIAERFFEDTVSKDGERGHVVHLGKLDGKIDVGIVSTGMGCPRCVVGGLGLVVRTQTPCLARR